VVINVYLATLPCRTNVTKQAISDKLQGSLATYIRCGAAVNNQIIATFKSSEYLAKLEARTWLSLALCAPCLVA